MKAGNKIESSDFDNFPVGTHELVVAFIREGQDETERRSTMKDLIYFGICLGLTLLYVLAPKEDAYKTHDSMPPIPEIWAIPTK